ncbi:MAG: acyltransferase family protein [Thermodesulfobacteriota bacterium]
MDRTGTVPRIAVIDVARFYAMALVYYGHFIEEFMNLKNPVAATQYKFIYSFHMVLFIVLAGYVAKEQDADLKLDQFLRSRFYSRFLPFLFFTGLMMIPPVFVEGKFFGLVLPSVEGYTKGVVATLFGLPYFCVPSWFLLLVMGVEIVHYSAFRFMKQSPARMLLLGLLFYLAGYWFNRTVEIFNPLAGRIVGWNYFFIHEAVTLYAFYLMGLYLRRKQVFIKKVPVAFPVLGGGAAFLILLFTYRLNTGPFNFNYYDSVVIMMASHGHVWLFPLTAIAGSAFILFLAQMTPTQKAFAWMGENTLILMCLNGIFYHYINPGLAGWVLKTFSGSASVITTSGIITTIASLLLCMPLVFVLNTYVPQLVGKPKTNGPLLPSLVPPSGHRAG